MAVGISATNLANPWLNLLRGTSFTAKTGVHVKLHTGDPGAAGTTAASAVTTRSQVSFAAASGGVLAITGTNPTWVMTGTETISHVSYWDDSTAGNFLWSCALAVSKNVTAGDTLTLTVSSLTMAAIAS